MNKIFGNLFAQFNEFFKGLGPTKRVSIIGAAVIAVVAGLVIVVMVSGRDYAPLLTDVPSDQLAMFTGKLAAMNVPYRLVDEGKSITVPKEMLHATLMTLMSEVGSSRVGNIGLELFDKQDLSASSFAQKIQYQRALQGELIRSINTLTAVKQSKVIVALPTKKNFLEAEDQPSASVVVELHPGKTLTADQIRGIRYLVSSAVQGLEPEKVTVVDDRGKMLTFAGDTITGGSNEILELKRRIESELEERVEALLSKVVGQARVVARVDATLTNRVVNAVEETVDGERTAIRSQTTDEESLDGRRNQPAGVPGAQANLPGGEGQNQIGMNQNVKKELKTINYDVPKTVKNIREMAGNLERISVAVLVDGVLQNTTKEDGTVETKWIERGQDELKKYETLVKSAIGFNTQRGDSVKIENIQFIAEDFSEADRLLTSLERRKLMYALFKWILLGFSLGLFFFIVVRPFMQWITDSFQESVEDMLPRTIEELEELQSVDNTLPGMSSALPVLEESIDPDKAESELLKDRIISIMEQDNEKASNAFSMWVAKREG